MACATIFTICDAKRADIGNTNEGYVKSIFDWLGFDAVTLHPYLGSEALEPFLNSSRGIISSGDPKAEARKLCEEVRKYSK